MKTYSDAGTNSFWGELVIEHCHRRQFLAYKSVASGRPDKVRFRGLAKNATQMVILFALSNRWMARRHLLASTGEVRLKCGKWLL